MIRHTVVRVVALAAWFALGASVASAADYPAPKQGDWIAKGFKFHTGEVMDLKLHYTTVGEPSGQPVLMLHGTSQFGGAMLTPAFAGELFGPGQPLDATKYFIVLPDGIGHGQSTKPSDGLRAKFPKYDYADMVDAHYRLLTEGLGIKRLRLVMGNSMGGMHTWLWGEKYPDFMDALVPMASQPTAMAGRNWIMRRLIIDSVKNDPDWHDGNYTTQPKSLKAAAVFFGIATSGGTLAYAKLAPTREAADKMLDERLAARFTADANDFMYQWESSGDYDASPSLARITAQLLAINAADDERNPPETGLTEAALKQVKNGRLYLIPASTETRGHGTTGMAKFYTAPLAEFLRNAPTAVR
jgi:homoserine O-acetyltransferase